MLDLRDWQFEKDGAVDLVGEYEFYWHKLISPAQFADSIPPEKSAFVLLEDVWNSLTMDGKKLPGHGFATYRLTILFKEPPPALALKFLDMGTAFSVFANREKVLSVGQVGTDEKSSVPAYYPQMVDLPPLANKLELIYQVSNFHHRRGGAWEIVQLGTRSQIDRRRERRLAFDLILFGSILIMGLYHLSLFMLRKEGRSAIYFGVFCLLIAIRLLTTVERFLLHIFPNISWELFVKIEYLSYYSSVAVFALFFYSLFPQKTHKPVIQSIVAAGLVFSTMVLLTPVKIFSHTLLAYSTVTLASSLYGLVMLVLFTIRKIEGAAIVLAGFIFLVASVVNDILDANRILHTGHFVQLGLFVFIFSQAFLLALRYSQAFHLIDRQRLELTEANQKYKQELIERQRAEEENRELQEKLTRAQKMEALGLLAGGVAHDLNNILAANVSLPELMMMDIPPDSSLKEPLRIIRQAGLKAAAVVDDLLALARRGVVHYETMSLNDIVVEYTLSPEHKNLMREFQSVKFDTQLSENLFNIKGSAHQLKKVIMNLVANAAEAQPNGGSIAVSTANRYLDHTINGYENIFEGNYAVLRIHDNGIGISSSDLKKIFEPFYTKKAMGRRSGTGLGMAVVWGTVHDHKGYIDVQSSVGKGTMIDLYFPVTFEECTKEKCTIAIDKLMAKNESILVVDDISEQRLIASTILKRLGYRVATAASGEEAVEYLLANNADLVILDMIMEPGIDGLETYERIVQIHPHQKAIIASGFAETDRVRQLQALGASVYIKKPYTLETIGLAVRAELDRHPA